MVIKKPVNSLGVVAAAAAAAAAEVSLEALEQGVDKAEMKEIQK
jgi:hypothetical protein